MKLSKAMSARSSASSVCVIELKQQFLQLEIASSNEPTEALSRLMAKECLRRKGGGEFFCEGDR